MRTKRTKQAKPKRPGDACLLAGCLGWSYTGTFCRRCHRSFIAHLWDRYIELIKLDPVERWNRIQADPLDPRDLYLFERYIKEVQAVNRNERPDLEGVLPEPS